MQQRQKRRTRKDQGRSQGTSEENISGPESNWGEQGRKRQERKRLWKNHQEQQWEEQGWEQVDKSKNKKYTS